MGLEAFPPFYKKQYERVNRALNRWLPAQDSEPPLLSEAVRYSVLNGGKRLRGVLVLEAGKLGECEQKVLEALAAAVEMIHAYSLVHDDLPAMDNDDFRRGKPSNHRKFGEDMAILAGDALLTRAFYVFSHLPESFSANKTTEILRTVTESIGGKGLIGGQVLDLKAEDEKGELEELNAIHRWKTGALINTSIKIGALAADVTSSLLGELVEFGKKIGLAFQIKDDLLDVTTDFETTGKLPGADQKNGKLTYPALLGVDDSKDKARKLIDRAEEQLGEVTNRGGRLIELARLVIERDH